jgi:DNA processing protein
MEVKQKKILNALNIALSPNTLGVLKILEKFPLPETAYNINEENLTKLGFKQNTILNFLRIRGKTNIEKEWQKLEREDIKIITKDENEYPELLAEISKPPVLLYVKGELLPEEKYFSCIGTRWPSDYGKMIVPEIISDIVNYNFTVVSGMARGIDTLSHKEALERGKRTIAIVGTGLDIVFPPENKNLAKEIEKNGAIISEFPLQTPPLSYNFPQRNRIIAGITMGTLVIEAKEKSGALITANLALEENREVFAVPGPIYSKTSKGCNNLIKQGAHPVTSSEDILSVFNIEKGLEIEKEIKGDTEEENLILDLLKVNPCSIDEIIKKTKIDTSVVNSTLILLEIEKKIGKTGEKYYINSK